MGPENKTFIHGSFRAYEPWVLQLLSIADGVSGALLFVFVVQLLEKGAAYQWQGALFIFLLSILFFKIAGIYRSWRFSKMANEIAQIIRACIAMYLVIFVLIFSMRLSDVIGRDVLLSWMLGWPLVLTAERIALRKVLRHFRRKGYNIRKAVVVGTGGTGQALVKLIQNNLWSGTQIVGFFDDHENQPTLNKLPVLGQLQSLPVAIERMHIDIVYIALPMDESAKIRSLIAQLDDSTVSIHFVPDVFFLDLIFGSRLILFDNLPVVALRDTPIRGINSVLKRVEDIVLSSAILVLLSPLLLAIAAAVKLSSRGLVIFKQYRYGLNGRKFKIYKFRTMNVCEDGYAFTQAIQNDRRITPLGAFLRRTSLDELPQLFNVLQGHMSLVGPRPHPVAMNEAFRKRVNGYMLRHKVKPGIVGLAQLNGFRGETDTLEKMEKRIEYDLKYLRDWSIILDLQILFKTIFSGAWYKNAH